MKRWNVTISWHTNSGWEADHYFIDELEELAEILEHGPDWNCLKDIRINYALKSDDGPKTLEEWKSTLA